MDSPIKLLPRMPFVGMKFESIKFEIIKFSEFNPQNLPPTIRIDQAHYIDFHLVIFCIKSHSAKANIFINFECFSLTESELIFIPQNSIISFDFAEAAEGYSILFTDSFLIQNNISISLLSSFGYLSKKKKRKIALTPPELTKLDFLYQAIYLEYHDINLHNKKEILQSLMKSILLKIEQFHQSRTPISSHNFNTFKKFKTLLEDNHTINKNINYYCKKLHITSLKLNEICQLYCNCSTKKTLTIQLLLEAKKLLKFSALSIKEIAFKLGFSESTNFSKFFSRNENCSPKQFRQS